MRRTVIRTTIVATQIARIPKGQRLTGSATARLGMVIVGCWSECVARQPNETAADGKSNSDFNFMEAIHVFEPEPGLRQPQPTRSTLRNPGVCARRAPRLALP